MPAELGVDFTSTDRVCCTDLPQAKHCTQWSFPVVFHCSNGPWNYKFTICQHHSKSPVQHYANTVSSTQQKQQRYGGIGRRHREGTCILIYLDFSFHHSCCLQVRRSAIWSIVMKVAQVRRQGYGFCTLRGIYYCMWHLY